MILPNKNIKLENSLMGIGFIILRNLNRPSTISSIWERVKNENSVSSFEKFVLALDFLFTVGVVDFQDGLIRKK